MAWIITLLFVIILLCTSVSASYISISSTITSEIVNENTIKITISLTNIGDEKAYEIEAIPILPDGNTAYTLHSKGIPPEGEESTSFNISFNEEITPGTHPFVLKVTYHDANMYQFSTVSSHLMKTVDSPISKIRGTIENTEITTEGSGSTALTIWNDADDSLDLKISFFLPNELKASLKQMNVSINPSEEKQIQIDVGSFGALVGSSYVILASIEYDSDFHYTSFVHGIVKIVEYKYNKVFEISSYWMIFVLIILVAIFVVYQIWEIKRGK